MANRVGAESISAGAVSITRGNGETAERDESRRASLARMGIEDLEAGIRELFAQLEAQESQRQKIEASIVQTEDHLAEERSKAEAMPYSGRAREGRLGFLLQAEAIAVTSRQVLATQQNIAELAQLLAGLTREVARIKEQLESS